MTQTLKKAQLWRSVRHPLLLVHRKGWRWGRHALISPRGTVFVLRPARGGLVARKRQEFQLAEN